MRNSSPHLEEDLLLRAVIDEGDLTWEHRRHLMDCPRCRRERERLEKSLVLLGRRAAGMTPPPPAIKSPAPLRKIRRPIRQMPGLWRPLTAMAAAAVMAFSVWWGAGHFRDVRDMGPGFSSPESKAPEQLMIEINALAENPLPRLYLDLLGESDTAAGEDFIQFLMPAMDKEPNATDLSWKGVILCATMQASPCC